MLFEWLTDGDPANPTMATFEQKFQVSILSMKLDVPAGLSTSNEVCPVTAVLLNSVIKVTIKNSHYNSVNAFLTFQVSVVALVIDSRCVNTGRWPVYES